jgi:arylsulfatase A-like enzyme
MVSGKFSTVVSLCTLGIILLCASGLLGPAENLPNVVLVLLDDVGYGDLKVYNEASKIPLPNIETLAERGMVFTDAHSPAAICSPTRYSVMTGNYPWRGRRLWGIQTYNEASMVLEEQRTIGHVMKNAGYRSAMIGKYHLGGYFYRRWTRSESEFFLSSDFAGPPSPTSLFAIGEEDFSRVDFLRLFSRVDFLRRFRGGPLDLGFDYSFLLLAGIQGEPHAFFENDTLVGDSDDLAVVADDHGEARIGMPDWATNKVGPELTTRSLQFLRRHFRENRETGTARPFFLYYCSQAVHPPVEPAEEIMGTPVKGRTFDKVGDSLYEFDVTLGKLMDGIAEHGQLDNTLFLVTSDNGAFPNERLLDAGHDSNGGLAGWKGMVWEGGHRVPLIVAWGDGTLEASPIRPRRRSNALVGLQDIYATFAELTGQAIETDQGLDSHSFLSVLLGEGESQARRHLLAQGLFLSERFPRQARLAFVKRRQAKPARMLRDGSWKLIVQWRVASTPDDDPVGQPLGLFNLAVDPGERNNLVNDPSKQRRLAIMLRDYDTITQSKRSTEVTP